MNKYNELKKYYTIGTVPKSNKTVVKRNKIATPNTKIYIWLGKDISIKRGGFMDPNFVLPLLCL